MLSYIEKFNILSENQFGFTKGKSTSDAVLSFVDFIHGALNRKEHVVSLFIDLKKSFRYRKS